MKPNTVVKDKKTKSISYRVIDSTVSFRNKKKIKLLQTPTKDMDSIEWWENHIAMQGIHQCLVQVERSLSNGSTDILGYNIWTEKPINSMGKEE